MIKRIGYLLIVLHGWSLLQANYQIPKTLKYMLKNGLTVLIRPIKTSQPVSLQIWYNAGAKDEQKGLAHLLEHMIFKGTELLSESDIPFITHKLSGSCNATTSPDWTRYLFNVPSQNWRKVLPIMADCMRNCTIKQDLLNSELKAVVQELKMYRDNYIRSLIEKMTTTIFSDHPYHTPTVGFKHDLLGATRESMLDFYHKHYVPNNATLIVVGDVDPDEVIQLAQKNFESLEANKNYTKQQYHFDHDLVAQTVTLYRDIKQSFVALAYVIPGSSSQNSEEAFDMLSTMLTQGRNTRLHKKLVEELQLVNSISSSCMGLFDHGLFIISFEPKNIDDVETIITIINEQLEDIKLHGAHQDELKTASKKLTSSLYNFLESTYNQASVLGELFLATGDENCICNYQIEDVELINNQIKTLLADYFRPSIMHKGFLLPLPESEKNQWKKLQEKSDKLDTQILTGKIRESSVEQPQYAHNVTSQPRTLCDLPKPKSFKLSNNLDVMYHHNPYVPKIEITLDLKVTHHYEPKELQGLYHILCYMMHEGTKNYTAEQFAQELESNGIALSISSGAISMSMLSDDFQKGLELLCEVVTNVVCSDENLNKVKAWALSDYQHYSDNAHKIMHQLMREYLFPGHSLSQNPLADPTSIEKITCTELKEFYQKYISPQGASLAIVGNLQQYDIAAMVEKTLGSWTGPAVKNLPFPESNNPDNETITHVMNRDQMVLSLGRRSVCYKDPDFDALLLLNHILCDGMSSRLFQLRVQSGAFYSISGSLLAGSGKTPGIAYISTMVSNDRVDEVELMIKTLIDTVVDTITEQELSEAKEYILNIIPQHYSTNRSIANTFIFLNIYELPYDYFETREKKLSSITLEEVKVAGKKLLRSDEMTRFKVGRI